MEEPKSLANKRSKILGMRPIELFIVFAIIAILIGILLPAVRQIRQAARKATSMNNVRQLVLGAQNYESAHQRFPSAQKQIEGTEHSWEISIFCFLEANNLYSSISFSQSWNSSTNSHLFSREIPCFLNPSEPGKFDENGFGLCHYTANESVIGLSPGKTLDEVDPNEVMFGEISDGYIAWGKPGNCRPFENGIRFDASSFGNPEMPGAVVGYANGASNFVSSNAKRNAQVTPGYTSRKFPMAGGAGLEEFSCRRHYSPAFSGGMLEFACRFKGWDDAYDTPVTDAGLKRLATLKNLRGVKLGLHSKVTDEGMKQLGQLKELKYLNVGNVQLSGKGLRELYELKQLEELHFDSTLLTELELAELKSALPNCVFYSMPKTEM